MTLTWEESFKSRSLLRPAPRRPAFKSGVPLITRLAQPKKLRRDSIGSAFVMPGLVLFPAATRTPLAEYNLAETEPDDTIDEFDDISDYEDGPLAADDPELGDLDDAELGDAGDPAPQPLSPAQRRAVELAFAEIGRKPAREEEKKLYELHAPAGSRAEPSTFGQENTVPNATEEAPESTDTASGLCPMFIAEFGSSLSLNCDVVFFDKTELDPRVYHGVALTELPTDANGTVDPERAERFYPAPADTLAPSSCCVLDAPMKRRTPEPRPDIPLAAPAAPTPSKGSAVLTPEYEA